MTHEKPATTKLILAFAATYFIWGSTYLAIKYAVETIPPFLMMGTRSLVAGSILYAWSRYREDQPVQREHWRSLFIIGVAFFLVGHGLLAWAQKSVPSGLAALIVASEPMWIGLIETLAIRGFKLGMFGAIGLGLGFGGIVWLIAPTKGLGAHRVDLMGSAAILLATLSWSGGAVYQRVARLPRSPILTAGLELVIGGAFLVSSGLFLGEFETVRAHAVSLRSLLSLAYLIVGGSLVAFTAYVWLLTVTTATRVATHTYVNPVIAIVLGWAVASEPISFTTIFASIVIIASVYLVLNDRTAKQANVSYELTELRGNQEGATC
jgi:drug/metabolite transporter (DMT)-like permease